LQPTKLKADFLEQFTDGWEKRWKPSHAKKDTAGSDTEEEWAYVGEWAVEEPTVYPGMKGDKGLVVKNAAAHHAISAKFPKKIDNKGKTLVVQYEVKLQGKSTCRFLSNREFGQSLRQMERRWPGVRWCLPEAPP
jgi:calnexin